MCVGRTYSPGVPTFPLGYSSRNLWGKHQRMLKRQTNTAPGKVSWVQDPVDPRGVPLIGRGVQGAIRWTRPGDNLR
jgi:hypothetical protein